MGSSSSKREMTKHDNLSDEEFDTLSSYFKTVNEGKGLKISDVQTFWNKQVNNIIFEGLQQYLFTSTEILTFDQFVQPLIKLLRGSTDDKTNVVLGIINCKQNVIPVEYIHKYVECVLQSYIAVQKSTNTKKYQSWAPYEGFMKDDKLTSVAKYICKEINKNSQEISRVDTEKWISSWTLMTTLQNFIYLHLYNVLFEDDIKKLDFFPMCENITKSSPFPSILSWSNVIFLNHILPTELQSEWRFLYSTKIHGESFAKLLGLIVGKGPTIVITKDRDGHIFGGFAPVSWNLNPNFIGNETSFLFSLSPSVEKYEPTGYNNHFQYLHVQQQTLPNGLGMGGQFEYMGFWLDAEFGTGHCSETCTTYQNYCMLSGKKNFNVEHVEVWALGPEPKSEEEKGERSILDSHAEARAVMEMAGKVRYSDGYREPQEDD